MRGKGGLCVGLAALPPARNDCLVFKVYKSLHYHTIQINQPTRCNNLSSLLLDVIYSSTCFGRPHAHHQELDNCSSSLWFNRCSVVIAVLLVGRGRAGQPVYDQQHCYHHATTVKPEAAAAAVGLLRMGVGTPKTC